MLGGVCVWAAPTVKTVTLTDYLGSGWQDELVHYSLTFAEGELTGKAMARVEVKGGAALPSQVSDIERFDDGSIHSMNVWFFATIPSNGAVTYRILPGKRGPADTGVTVKSTADTLEMTTDAPRTIGIRLLNGGKEYFWPVPASGVPGPLQALLLPSGRSTGAGHFAVPFKVKSYHTEVVAQGPLFAEARVHYLFEGGYWTFTTRVIRGCPMVRISEEVDTGNSGQNWDAADRFYVFTLNGNGFKPTQAYYTGRTEVEGFHDLVNQYVQPVLQDGLERGGPGSSVNGYTLSFAQNRLEYYLTPWPTWSTRTGVAMRFVEPGKDAIGFASVKTTAWKNPLSLRFHTATSGELTLSLPLQMYRPGWPSEGFGYHSPNYTGQSLMVPETTARRDYGIMLTSAEDEQQAHIASLLRQTAKLGAQPLDEVKDWVLEWSDPLEKAAWAATTGKVGQEALTQMRHWLAAKRAVGNYGSYSMWTYYSFLLTRYKTLSPILNVPAELSATDRKALRRLCAFQAYVLNSLDEFPWGAGPHLGNPNMSCMAMAARAQSAALVKDHPMFRAWGEWTLAFTRDYFVRYVREGGAPYECPGYTVGVTLGDTTTLNKTLLDAGIGDAFDTPQFKSEMFCLLDWSMPPDPRFFGHRQMLPFGNGYAYQSFPVETFTRLVEYYRARDPHLAAQLQWTVNRSQPDDKQLKIVADETPVLRSRYYPDYGVYFRHGFGTPYETCLFLMAGNCEGHYEWETEQMAYSLVAKGQPINLHFYNGYGPMFIRPWLRNRVTIDHMLEETERNATRVLDSAFTPEAEYAHATRDIDSIRPLKTEYPLTDKNGGAWAPEENIQNWLNPVWQRIPMTVWHRQMLFLKDADPQGPNYFVLRDTFAGSPTRATDDSLWFLANDMTGQGPLYHFDGQCKADMDVFVASPSGCLPETGEYGHPMFSYSRPVKSDPHFFPNGQIEKEVQHFLRLKQPAGKGYLVALYPRLKGIDPPAEFTTPAENVIHAVTPLSTDYAFLNSTAFDFKDARVTFHGTAGALRFYNSGKIAVVNTEGHAEFTVAGKSISGDGPFNVIMDHDSVTITPRDARVTVN